MQNILSLNCEKELERIIFFIQENFKKSGLKKVIVACSGGIDSSLCLFLLVKALSKKKILALQLPNGKQDMELSKLAIKTIKLPKENVFGINIAKSSKKIMENLIEKEKIFNLRKGNVIARLRMIYLYDLAKTKQALVCGTENRSEYFLGYFTRFGDSASDFNPISQLYKTQVREMSKYLNLPEKIISATPTAGLWKGQTDEKEFGFSYAEADQIIYLYCDKNKSHEEIVKLGFKNNLVAKVIKRIESNIFKREVPYQIDKE